MGVWSTSILGNDLSSDAYAEFIDSFKRKGAEISFSQVEKELEEIDEEEKEFYLSAIIYAEWKCDIVNKRHLQELITLRNSDNFAMLWPNENDKKRRARVIDKVINNCLADNHPKKPIKCSTQNDTATFTNWNQWDVYAYKLSSSTAKKKELYGKYMVLQKIGENHSDENHCDIIRIVNHAFSDLEDCLNFDSYTLLPEVTVEVLSYDLLHDIEWFEWELSRSLHYSMFLFEPNDYPSRKLFFLTNSPKSFEFDRITGNLPFHDSYWKQFERHTLIDLLEEWENKEDELKRFLNML